MAKVKLPGEETSLDFLDKKLKKEANIAIKKTVAGEEDA